MLVLSRQKGEVILLEVAGQLIEVHVVQIRGDTIRIGIQASPDVKILRGELRTKPDESAPPSPS